MNKHRLNIAKKNINNFNSISKNIINRNITVDVEPSNYFDESEIEKRTLSKLIDNQKLEIDNILTYITSKVDLYKKSAKISNDNLYYYGMIGALLDIEKLLHKMIKTEKGV